MSEIKNFQEAKLYITTNYVFSNSTYPILRKLNQQEQHIFICKYCLLELYEKMHIFLTEAEKILYEITVEFDYTLIEASATIMINILKIAEVAEVDLVLHADAWHFRQENKDVLKHAGKIAVECKKFDRTGKYNIDSIGSEVNQLWYQFIKILNFEKLSFYEEMYKVIGIVM